MIVNKQLARNY